MSHTAIVRESCWALWTAVLASDLGSALKTLFGLGNCPAVVHISEFQSAMMFLIVNLVLAAFLRHR
jgi:hypothetical protein